MENSIVLARFMGPYIIVIGFGLLLNLKYYRRMSEDFFAHAGLVYITGLITFVAGLAIVLFHNVWCRDWRVIITLFGWNALIKGVGLVVFPIVFAKMADRLVKNIKLVALPWVLMLAIGIFLTIKGYFF